MSRKTATIQTTAPATAPDPFVPLTRLCRATGLTRSRASVLAITGRLRTRTEPGMTPRYSLEDARRLADGTA